MSKKRTNTAVADGALAGASVFSARVLALVGLTLGLLLSPRAAANIYAYSYSFSMPVSDWQDTLYIAKFNETLTDPSHLDPNNSLLRVGLVFQATLTADLVVTNANAVSQTVDVVFGTNVAVSETLLTGQVVDADPSYHSTVALPAYSSVYLYNPSPSGSDSSTYSSTNSTDLAFFTGSGTITATIAPTTDQVNWLTFPQPGGGWGKLPPEGDFSDATITGTLWVYYHTPEPGALALLCLGLAVGFCRRDPRRT
jgi:hypothetical protein